MDELFDWGNSKNKVIEVCGWRGKRNGEGSYTIELTEDQLYDLLCVVCELK